MNKPLPFQIRLTNVEDINPKAGFEKGEIYDVYEETRDGYNILSGTFGTFVEIYCSECERVIPEIKGNKKGTK